MLSFFSRKSKPRSDRRFSGARRLRFEALESRRVLSADSAMVVTEFAEGEASPMPDFSLVDVNQTSATANQTMSPRDYLLETSAWYFGHGS